MRIIIFLCSYFLCYHSFSQSLEKQLEALVKNYSLHKSEKIDTLRKTINLSNGIIRLPPQFSNKKTGTMDSEMGKITNGFFLMEYDIGVMAGTRMHKDLKEKCRFYTETYFRGYKTCIGLLEKNNKSELIITIYGKDQMEIWSLPANFLGFVKTEKEMEDILDIAMSYIPKVE